MYFTSIHHRLGLKMPEFNKLNGLVVNNLAKVLGIPGDNIEKINGMEAGESGEGGPGLPTPMKIYNFNLSDTDIVLHNNATTGSFSGVNMNVLSLDGTNDYADISAFADNMLDHNPEHFTLTCFIRRTSNTTAREVIVFRNYNSGNSHRWGFNIKQRKLGFSGANRLSNTIINQDTWYHVGMAYNDSTGQAKMYVNGQPASGTNTYSINNTAFADSDKLYIGMETDGTTVSDDYEGQIGLMKFYNTPLTDLEMSNIFTSESGSFFA